MSAILEFADKLRAQIDIADVVGRYVDLRRLGTNMKGLCPFHNEKTPSFTVSTSKQIFHCFGCHEGGDVIKFVQKIERVEWMDAVRHLSREFGIPMPEFTRDRSADPRAAAVEQDSRDAALAAVRFAADFFAQHLKAQISAGGEIREYLNRRGLGPDAAARFGLGLAPDAWTGLMDSAQRAGHSREALLNGGLIIRHATKDSQYDRFRKRLIFPIHDTHGQPVAFGARVFAADASPDEPKYINSPETLAYHKGQALYALHLARDTIVREQRAVLMEGYMDVIAAHMAGVTSCIASCGTALTDEQARLLKRFCSDVVFVYDGDEAGQKAMLRGTEILLAQGLNVSIVNLPNGHDPDSFLREHGADAFKQQVETARNFFEHFMAIAASRYDLRAAEGKVRAVEMLAPLLRRVKQAIAKNDYVRRLADRLQVDAILIHRQVSTTNPNSLDRLRQVVSENIDGQESVVEKTLLKLVLDCPQARTLIREKVDPRWLRSPFVKKWYAICREMQPEELTWEALMNSENIESEEEIAAMRSLAIADLLCDDSSPRTIEHVASRIHRNYLRTRNALLIQEIDAFFQGNPQDDEVIHRVREADQTPVKPLLNKFFLKPDITPDRH